MSRLPLLLALTVLLLAPALALAAPLDRIILRQVGPATPARTTQSGLSAAAADTMWFGGTMFDPIDGRWEAMPNSCWTFDSGVGSHYDFSDPDVNPFKDTALHARMEGWVGMDLSFEPVKGTFARRTLTDPFDVLTSACVGFTVHPTWGLGSFYCGVLPTEAAALCYVTGQGYGNDWNIAIEKTFAYDGSGSATLSFDLRVESEPGFDYLSVEVDSSGAGDWNQVQEYSGSVLASESFLLTAGGYLPASAGNIRIRFRASSDVWYSDEDGLAPTSCGLASVDNIRFAGGAIDDFEAGDLGWVVSEPEVPGPGGDWSNLVALADLPTSLAPGCDCALGDSVLVFEDLPGGGHGPYQENLAVSPWIDLVAHGQDGRPRKTIQFDLNADLPLANYVFLEVRAQWYPEICPLNGGFLESDFTRISSLVYHFGDAPVCGPQSFDFSSVIPVGAERVRLALGVISLCRFYPGCTGMSNSTPWIDNVKFGVSGYPDAPVLSVEQEDLPMDAFPTSGAFDISGTAFVESNHPGAGLGYGDTLVVRGGQGGAEVYVQFAVDPGPGIDAGALNAWLGGHTSEGTWLGLDWYSARMDTALIGNAVKPGFWATLYHETDPNFIGNQFVLDGSEGFSGRKLNDIFPDDLFTPGTRLLLFYKATFDGSDFPSTGIWTVLPDTTGGNHLEMEVMPSSMAADSTWNCILYVDHADGYVGQDLIEPALANVLTGSSASFEGTAWDRFDVRAPSSGGASFGGGYLGARSAQLAAYGTIFWDSGAMSAFNLNEADAAVLRNWLDTSEPGTTRHLYLAGDDLARTMSEGVQSASLLEDALGVAWTCDAVREASCPGGPAILDTTHCLPVVKAGTSHFPGNGSTGHVVSDESGCASPRRFDRLATAGGGQAVSLGNESYLSPVKGLLHHASVSALAGAPYAYRGVVDGVSLSARRNAFDCTGTEAITDRLQRVFNWFGVADGLCDEPPLVGIPDGGGELPAATRLAAVRPNPVRGTEGARITFDLADREQVRLEVYDVTGRLVRVLVDGTLEPGAGHEVSWDVADAAGRTVPRGIYFTRFTAGTTVQVGKLVVLGD